VGPCARLWAGARHLPGRVSAGRGRGRNEGSGGWRGRGVQQLCRRCDLQPVVASHGVQIAVSCSTL
jgi:hypothetical protein